MKYFEDQVQCQFLSQVLPKFPETILVMLFLWLQIFFLSIVRGSYGFCKNYKHQKLQFVDF